MNNPLCPDCGQFLHPDIRPMTTCYKGLSVTFNMPGWYCACGEGIVTGKDMDVSDRQLNLLKARIENAVLPSKAISNLLRVLEAMPEGLKVLREASAEIMGI